MRIRHTQILVRIHGHIIDAHFVMKVGTGAAPAVADVADSVTAMNVLSRKYCEAFQMSVARRDSVPVIEQDRTAVAAHEIGKLNHAFRRSHNRLPVSCANINS